MAIIICFLFILIEVVILAVILNGIQVNQIRKQSVNFKDYLKYVGLPIISLYQNNKQYNFLLDSGANYSCISNNVLEELEYSKSNKTTNLYGIDGTTKTSECVTINLHSNTSEYEEIFQVISPDAFDLVQQEHNVKIVGILGNIFMAKNNIILDFKDNKVYPI